MAHNEHKIHTELWDVNCLTVYCLLLNITPEELLSYITDSDTFDLWHPAHFLVGQSYCAAKLCSMKLKAECYLLPFFFFFLHISRKNRQIGSDLFQILAFTIV